MTIKIIITNNAPKNFDILMTSLDVLIILMTTKLFSDLHILDTSFI